MTCEYDSPIPKQQAKKAALKLEVNLPYKVGGVSLHALLLCGCCWLVLVLLVRKLIFHVCWKLKCKWETIKESNASNMEVP